MSERGETAEFGKEGEKGRKIEGPIRGIGKGKWK